MRKYVPKPSLSPTSLGTAGKPASQFLQGHAPLPGWLQGTLLSPFGTIWAGLNPNLPFLSFNISIPETC
jgi:hypothetical protein